MMAVPEMLDSLAKTLLLRPHHRKQNPARNASSHRTARPDPQGRLDQVEDLEIQDHQDNRHSLGHRVLLGLPEAMDILASLDTPDSLVSLDNSPMDLHRLDSPALLDLLVTREATAHLGIPVPTDILEIKGRPETVDQMARQEVPEPPEVPELPARTEREVDATTAHLHALPLAIKCTLQALRLSILFLEAFQRKKTRRNTSTTQILFA